MTMHRKEVRFTGCLAILIALAGAMLMTAPPVRAGSSVVVGAGNLNFHPHFGMHPRIAVHPGFGMASPRSIGMLPPLGSGIVPPLGPNMVPPLVSGTCCRDGFTRGRPHRFPFFPFLGGVYVSPPPSAVAVPAPVATAPALPPPPPDFEPRLVSLKPFARQSGDPASITVLRAGEPEEVVTFAAAPR